jgi:hypothetical protein
LVCAGPTVRLRRGDERDAAHSPDEGEESTRSARNSATTLAGAPMHGVVDIRACHDDYIGIGSR